MIEELELTEGPTQQPNCLQYVKYMYVYMDVCVRIALCISMYICTCILLCMCVYSIIYVCIYVHNMYVDCEFKKIAKNAALNLTNIRNATT